MDCTATGVNAAAVCPRFAYLAIKGRAGILGPNAVMGVSDVSRYIYSFPWSIRMRNLMRIQWYGQT